MMRRVVLIGLGCLLLASVRPTFGQNVRPQRIRFTPGASSSTVAGVLTAQRDSKEYVLRAAAGQTLSFALSKSKPQVRAAVYEITPGVEPGREPLTDFPERTGAVTLPKSGDYIILVTVTEDPIPKAGLRFSLTVEIR